MKGKKKQKKNCMMKEKDWWENQLRHQWPNKKRWQKLLQSPNLHAMQIPRSSKVPQNVNGETCPVKSLFGILCVGCC